MSGRQHFRHDAQVYEEADNALVVVMAVGVVGQPQGIVRSFPNADSLADLLTSIPASNTKQERHGYGY